MLKPTRTTLALATGSLVLGLVGAGAAVADEGPTDHVPPREIIVGERPSPGQPGTYPDWYHATGRVVSKGPLKVRSRPSTRGRIVGQVYPKSKLEIECKEYGETVDGNRLWYRLAERNDDGENGTTGPDRTAYGDERWVSARYVKNLTQVRYCR